ncbi:hypothetical protein POX_a01535 [Penicillium oxalicum]|uniref:Uncharacterized protein n=1 Tax=Penicillium oxalicum (strain 114-2 / CGMCC 5302) TaxID=933388 RepID=S7ZSS7_PENO1|nr:hypothetical protein POX_a01535 [Penicillium oxalicum]EPS33474.1 hypothetical protein PDE_08436 [Penicillium oxalicum 114-2]KAI2794934.1 hypothetical protein POX_a01535 [Penicillium oxalicum]
MSPVVVFESITSMMHTNAFGATGKCLQDDCLSLDKIYFKINLNMISNQIVVNASGLQRLWDELLQTSALISDPCLGAWPE